MIGHPRRRVVLAKLSWDKIYSKSLEFHQTNRPSPVGTRVARTTATIQNDRFHLDINISYARQVSLIYKILCVSHTKCQKPLFLKALICEWVIQHRRGPPIEVEPPRWPTPLLPIPPSLLASPDRRRHTSNAAFAHANAGSP